MSLFRRRLWPEGRKFFSFNCSKVVPPRKQSFREIAGVLAVYL